MGRMVENEIFIETLRICLGVQTLHLQSGLMITLRKEKKAIGNHLRISRNGDYEKYSHRSIGLCRHLEPRCL
jgi:hypothetical protein